MRSVDETVMINDKTPLEGITVRFWGVRGSTPVSGDEFRRYGGHTPCVEVRLGRRIFIVDAGSGIGGLGAAWPESVTEIDLLLSHLHHDHVMGLPFFAPLCRAETHLTVHCGNLGGASAEEAFRQLFSPPLFPLPLDRFPAQVSHHGFQAGERLLFDDGIVVSTIPLRHPGGATGYRFDHAGRSVCYLSDLEHDPEDPDEALAAFVQGADLVIYDAMFTEAEYPAYRGWGHSTWQQAVDLAGRADVGSIATFHHRPCNDDGRMDLLQEEIARQLPGSFCAREGQTVVLAPTGQAVSL